MSKITIAIVGAGLIGPRHAMSVETCDDAELLCIVDPCAQARSIADSFQTVLFASIQQMLKNGCVPDAAFVCTPNSTHVAVAKELLAAGIHVLVEKPMSTTIEDGRDLLQAANISGKQLLVGHHRRFNPYVVASKQALLAGSIGRIVAISGLWATYKPASYFEAPTRWRAEVGNGEETFYTPAYQHMLKIHRSILGGVILINMIHEVDVLQYLLGPIIRVHAEQTVSQRTHDVEEGAAILLRFSSGCVGTFILSDATPSPHFFESGTGENPIIPKKGRDFYRIFGTQGTLSVGDMNVSSYTPGEKSWTEEIKESPIYFGNEIPFDEQAKHFVRVIKEEEKPRCSGEDGLSALIVCDAIEQALRSNAAVDVQGTAL